MAAFIICAHLLLGKITWFLVGLLLGGLAHNELSSNEIKFNTTAKPAAVASGEPPSDDVLIDLPDAIEKSVSDLLDKIINAYVRYWYDPLELDDSFPQECRSSLEYAINGMYSSLSKKNKKDVFKLVFESATANLFVMLRQLKETAACGVSVSEYISRYPDSDLASITDDNLQKERLRTEADAVLRGYAKPSDFQCMSARCFIREVLAVVVFNSAVTSLSHPDSVNEWLVYFFKTHPQTVTTRIIDQAVDAAKSAPSGYSSSNTGDSADSKPSENEPPQSFSQTLERPSTADRVDRSKSRSPNKFLYRKLSLSPTRHTRHCSDLDVSTARAITSRTPSPTRQYSADELGPDEPLAGKSLLDAPCTVTIEPPPDVPSHKHVKYKHGFLIQISVSLSSSDGWIVFRSYSDFEQLDNFVRDLKEMNISSQIKNLDLPYWKNISYQDLEKRLSYYLQYLLSDKFVTDSFRVKKFFDKSLEPNNMKSVSPHHKRETIPYSTIQPPQNGVSAAPMKNASGNSGRLAGALNGIKKNTIDFAANGFGLSDPARSESPGVKRRRSHSRSRSTDFPMAQRQQSFEKSMQFPVEPLKLTRTNSAATGGSQTSTDDAPRAASQGGHSGAESNSELCSNMLQREQNEQNQFNKSQPSLTDAIGPEEISPKASTASSMAGRSEKANVLKSSRKYDFSQDEIQTILDISCQLLSEFLMIPPKSSSIKKVVFDFLKPVVIRNSSIIESVRSYLLDRLLHRWSDESHIATEVERLTAAVWPEGEPTILPNPEDIKRLKEEARSIFVGSAIPDNLRSYLGSSQCTKSLELVFEALQEQRIAKAVLVNLLCNVLRAIM